MTSQRKHLTSLQQTIRGLAFQAERYENRDRNGEIDSDSYHGHVHAVNAWRIEEIAASLDCLLGNIVDRVDLARPLHATHLRESCIERIEELLDGLRCSEFDVQDREARLAYEAECEARALSSVTCWECGTNLELRNSVQVQDGEFTIEYCDDCWGTADSIT